MYDCEQELEEADTLLLNMVAGFKAVLVYFGKREAEAETDKEKCEEVTY